MVNTRNLLVHYIAVFPLILFLDGYLTEQNYFYRLETIYLNSVLLFMFALTPMNIHRYVSVILIFSFALWLELVRDVQGLGGKFGSDVKLITRSSIFFILSFWFGRTLQEEALRYISRSIFFLISTFVLLHFFIGLGGVMNNKFVLKPIYTSYFQEGNVVSIFYTFVALITLLYVTGSFKKIALIILALFILGLMSSKIGLAMLSVILVYYYFRNTQLYQFILMRFLSYSAPLFVFLFLALNPQLIVNSIARVFVFFLPDGVKLLLLMEKIDPIAAITSGRSLKVEYFIDRFVSSGYDTIMFGSGFDVVLNNGWYIESDFFDMLQFVGVIGFMVLVIPVLAVVLMSTSNRNIHKNLSYGKSSLVFILLVSSLMSGHSLISPAVMMIFGVAIGIYSTCGRVEYLLTDTLRNENN